MKRRASGFSLVELSVVVVIILIVSAIAVPAIERINNAYRIDAAGHSVAGLLQQARLQAVKSNQAAYAQYNFTQLPNMVFVNADPAVKTYVAGNPDVALSLAVAFQTTLPADVNIDQLTDYLGVTPATTGSPSLQLGPVIGFNARGLPCMEGASPAVCVQQDAGGATPVFAWFISDGRGDWEAITVTAAGRIKTWRLANRDATLTACGYAVCWQ